MLHGETDGDWLTRYKISNQQNKKCYWTDCSNKNINVMNSRKQAEVTNKQGRFSATLHMHKEQRAAITARALIA